MNNYTTVLGEGKVELKEKKSVFYGRCTHVKTEKEALDFIAALKKEYPDATHHVFAYVLRENSIMRFSDDREPQGTAGMPVLDAIRKNNCTDTVIVVIRYFGGVLLGTGGLVHAYSAAANSALKAAEIITFSLYSFYKITVSYSDYQKIMTALTEHSFRITDTQFTDSVEIYGNLESEKSLSFTQKITEITCARGVVEFIEEKLSY